MQIYHNMHAEIVGIGITVLILGNADEYIRNKVEKRRLILQMGSPNNEFATEAVRMLKTKGWLFNEATNKINLAGINLSKADLNETYLEHAYIVSAKLNWSNLGETHMKGANLSDSEINHSNLSFADCNGAVLNNASLRNSNLTFANLISADLHRVDFQNANIICTDLSPCRFDRCKSYSV